MIDPPAIRLENVGKSFGSVEALSEIDLTIRPGEFFTLLGPSGSGKTTLLRIIAGLEPASTGTITIEGGTTAEARRAKRIGWVPQSPGLLPWRTVAGNVTLLTQINRRSNQNRSIDTGELLQRVGLAGFESSLPHQLSGGMQQRVALVRAFALGAPILLMDEPFAALDEITRAEMRHILLGLWQTSGAAVVFVTHSIAEAAYLSDRVAVLSARPGRITDTLLIGASRPRRPEIEDTPEFFADVTALREALRAAMGGEMR